MAIHFPVFITLGTLHISAHWVLESLAYTIGFALYLRGRRAAGDFLSTSERYTVIAAAILGAAFGSKVLFWLEDPALTLRHLTDPVYLMGGKTVVGALLGGTAAVEWVKSRAGIGCRTGDLFAMPLTVAIAAGRLGCFLGGLPDHTYGIATRLPWGVDFGDGIPRHPTQLYEILFLLALAVWLRRLRSLPHREGDLFRTFLTGYLAWRLAIDFLKPGIAIVGLTSIQWACALAILAYWRDIPRLLAPFRAAVRARKGAPPWEIESVRTSSTTPQLPSARSAIAARTAKSSSKTGTSSC